MTDPFSLARSEADVDAELIALGVERDRLDKETERLTDEIDERQSQIPYEQLRIPSLVGAWLITSDYRWHFDQAIAEVSGEARRCLELEKERVLALCQAIDDRRAAAEEAAGITALRRHQETLVEQFLAAQKKLMTTPAKTPAGVEVQLSVLRWAIEGDDDDMPGWIDTISAGVRGLAEEREAQP